MFAPSKNHDDNASTHSDDSQIELFSDVLASLRRDRVPSFCAALRKSSHERLEIPCEDIPPPIIDKPMFGSYHALFPVCFHDGLKWLLKIPQHGTRLRFDELASNALISEAMAMNFLRRNTSIPIPAVLAFHAYLDNELGCPYILMEFVVGISLYDCWFDKCRQKREQYRSNALNDIAVAMAQLDQFSFDSCGSLEFDGDGNPINVTSMRCVDHKATLDRVFSGDGIDEVCYFNTGPFQEVGPFYTRLLDQQTEPVDLVQRGAQMLLRLFLEWIPEPEDHRSKFVIAHPDFDIQNFIVSTEGHLRAIIDWDGVAVVPRSVGYESYPGWLTRDWDPAMYGWTEDMEHGVEPEGLWEDSPETLLKHRTEYQMLMKSALSQKQTTSNSDSFDKYEKPRPDSRTANSLYLENLLIASSNPPCMFPILAKFVARINQLLDRGSHEALDVFDIARGLVDDELVDSQLEFIKNGFQAIFKAQDVSKKTGNQM